MLQSLFAAWGEAVRQARLTEFSGVPLSGVLKIVFVLALAVDAAGGLPAWPAPTGHLTGKETHPH